MKKALLSALKEPAKMEGPKPFQPLEIRTLSINTNEVPNASIGQPLDVSVRGRVQDVKDGKVILEVMQVEPEEAESPIITTDTSPRP